MRNPFRSRAAELAGLEAAWEAERAQLQARLAAMTQQCNWFIKAVEDQAGRHERDMVASEARYAELLAKYDGLRREGFATPPVVPPVELAPKHEPSEIAKIIREQAEGDPRLARHLRSYDRKLKSEGLNEDQRIGRLVAWTSTEPPEKKE